MANAKKSPSGKYPANRGVTRRSAVKRATRKKAPEETSASRDAKAKESNPRDGEAVYSTLLDLVSKVPDSSEQASDVPDSRAEALVQNASLKATSISGLAAIPPGPVGLVTILPDVAAVWRLQRQMVADIAACYGRQACMTRETMLYCLCRHLGVNVLLRDVVVRAGSRFLIRRVSLRVIQKILRRVGVRVAQRLISRVISRWLPLIGALGVAGYAYYDTTRVGMTAIELFSGKIEMNGRPKRTRRPASGQKARKRAAKKVLSRAHRSTARSSKGNHQTTKSADNAISTK